MVTNKQIVEGYIEDRCYSSTGSHTIVGLTLLLHNTNIKESVQDYCKTVHKLEFRDKQIRLISSRVVKTLKSILKIKQRQYHALPAPSPTLYNPWIYDSIPVKCDWDAINKILLAKELG